MANFKIISQVPVGIDDYFADCVYGEEDIPIKVTITGPALVLLKQQITPHVHDLVGMAIDAAEELGWENDEVSVEVGSPILHQMTVRFRRQKKEDPRQ